MRKYLLPRFVFLLTVLGAAFQTAHAQQQSAARIWNEQLLDAIRRNVPNPPGHARNLHHVAVAMYDAWAAYDATAVGYLYNEKVSPLPGDIEAARHEAISYAAYRVLRSRFASPAAGFATSLASFDAKLVELGYSTTTGQALINNGTTPAEVGRRIGQIVLNWGAQDGFSKTTYPQAYDVTVNPNLDPNKSLSVLGNNGESPSRSNMPLGVGVPNGTDPNFWQPLSLSTSVSQNGIPTPGGIQTFVGVQSLATVPFSLTRSDPTKPWIDPGPPSRLSRPGQPSATDAAYKSTFMDVVRKTAHLNDSNTVNISPAAIGNNPLGTDNGTGYPINPITSTPYAANNVVHSDFARVLAEFWADGPNSETPPGHWHVLANEVADNPLTVKKIGGVGPTVNDLEWDVKTYLALSGAVHNAACAAWSLKRYYSGTRPITAIRYMCSKGQSSNPADLVTYNIEGIPLETDLVEVITEATTGPGGKHESIWDVYTNSYQPGSLHLNEIAVKGWPGEDMNNQPAPSIATHQSTVRWMLGKDWLPFQRKTFNTPAFPGYVSGHSTFSRSAAEVLASITGSAYFPGGFHHHTVAANSMQIDQGPSADVDLQWATYYDAADQAGQSRRYGGIHPSEDDFPARTIGSQVGISAYTKAQKLWSGTIQSESVQPAVVLQGNGDAVLTWPTVIGRYYKVQKSTNFALWSDANTNVTAAGATLTFTDVAPAVGTVYRIIETIPSAARLWNEQMLAAIRRNVPNPPAHARNLHHTAVAMYDAWAAYDATAVGYLYNEKIATLPGDVEAARNEAISYAAYRVLCSRFASGAGAATSLASFDSQLTALGFSTVTAKAAITNGTTPAEVGKRIGQMVLNWGAQDGFSQTAYPQAYDTTVNPNMDPALALNVLGQNVAGQSNMPLGYGIPAGTDPNRWQPLSLSNSITQNGIVVPGGIQAFVGVQSLATVPFSLTRSDPLKPWLDPHGGPSRLSTTGNPSSSDAAYKDNFMDVLRKGAKLNDNTVVNISPGGVGNNPLGSDNGTGTPVNPVTGAAYPVNNAKVGDYTRVLAEYWADGPNSETPPGHWHVLTNEVADDPDTVKKIGGTGPVVNNLEWDVKNYLAVSGATHDAACAAWSLKRYYSGTRPITAIRYMCSKGQSSDPGGPSYHPEGIPLETDIVEVITAATVAPGGKHEQIWDVSTASYQPGNSLDGFGNPKYIGQIAVYAWPGEHPSNLAAPSIATNQSTLRWMLGKDWLPFQRKTFNTPAFPGYVSGHSTFSRAAAEALTRLTGSANFPGGFHNHVIAANSLQIDLGPSAPVDLQWTTYYDAADQAGQSRRYGGIHPYEDDYHGREIGSQAGISAFTKAEKLWTGTIQSESLTPAIALQPDGSALVTWPRVPGRFYKVQKSTNFTTWSDLTSPVFASNSSGSYSDAAPTAGTTYRIVETIPSIARTWNEQILNAIRIDTPHPPKHARNLFHLATVMYNAWAAYDNTAIGYIHHERASSGGDVELARREAISYAAYRLLKARFASGPGAVATNAALDAQMAALGYNTATTSTLGTAPANVGNRITATILAWGLADGSNQVGGYSDPSYFNPQPAMIVLGNSGAIGGVPAGTDPNRWQPLALSTIVTQNGIPLPDTIQPYVGVTWLNTLPFALSRTNPTDLWLDPGPLYQVSVPGIPSATDASYKAAALEVLEKSSQLNSETTIDISPGAIGNNTLGADDGHGHPVNPITGQAYLSNIVKLGDFARVMAEFWADGPQSETPPGHWHVLANEVADTAGFEKRIGGTGPIVSDLEWDVKTYFALSAATHDAACACWGAKRYFEGPRPITMIRYLATQGQSSDPGLPGYSPYGIPLEDGVCEVITATTRDVGGKHYNIWDIDTSSYVHPTAQQEGKIVVYSWPSEPGDRATQTNTVRWMFGEDWVPYQRANFNTPAFPGYISGHSTFSRSAAEVLTAVTGSAYVPGGLGSFTANANSYLVFERGPSQTTVIQWATYYDAADLAGQSRRWGGIHPYQDDFPARIIGSQSGKQAWSLAQKYFTGSLLTEPAAAPARTIDGGGVTLTQTTQRGLYYHLESSTNLSTWTTVTPVTQATGTSMSFSDPTPFSASPPRFYRIVWDSAAP